MENTKANNNINGKTSSVVNSNTRAKNKTTSTQKKDYYEEITNKIIKALENNTRPWVQPWDGGMLPMPKRYNNTAYQGINMLILWQEAGEGGYSSPYWMTFKQAKTLGGNVRKGETGATIFYAGTISANNDNNDNNGSKERGSSEKKEEKKPSFKKFMKSYKVFNENQIEGLPEEYYKSQIIENENLKEHHLLPKLEEFIKNTKADIRYGGIKAYYKPSTDHIQIPEIKLFKNSNSYYSTICHELTHWSGGKERLNRNLGGKRFGDRGYAMEELVAELGASFLSSSLGINSDAREDHAPYIASWLKVLKSDKRAIFNAASLAQTASNYLLELSSKNNSVT
ncbi:MAG: zincin-like metallopeptidase domain-containing protein [Rickettsiaceae bacterium]|nr:zincin-like metallopeptidase domain-containing protein [Rickettsiaceae bacterium]MDP5021107.1 zincin-like metallopeptidase domain-containing protein [Rickettsiaceae bacterium]MDP5082715.1 zincin-like metallopeptidase domain-containing protein [Rickettsiaceae bacterium]